MPARVLAVVDMNQYDEVVVVAEGNWLSTVKVGTKSRESDGEYVYVAIGLETVPA
jgi:hypothetical protein